MADQRGTRSEDRAKRDSALPIPTDSPRTSYETGESSISGSSRGVTANSDRWPQRHGDNSEFGSSPVNGGSGGRHAASHRKTRQRSAGGFLLQDAATGERRHTPSRIPRRANNFKADSTPHTPEQRLSSSSYKSRTAYVSNNGSNESFYSPRGSTGTRSAKSREEPISSPARSTSARDSLSPTRIDTTKLVSMALNLSESRRIASGRRNVSAANPPRLSALSESSSGSRLKQHLQQQRKLSQSESPRLALAGLSSFGVANSPLQATIEAGQDGYRYQFSTSTRARAQKATEQLELRAEYRRLLEALPPLGLQRSSTASPPNSPTGHLRTNWKFGTSQRRAAHGRQYNPLQYIRNRKVRARERKVIDGEQLGFGDVKCVRDWVDKTIQKGSSTKGESEDDSCAMPPFPAAETTTGMTPLSKTSSRARRPRVDWFMEPCDMIADAYWIEQEDHKYLIENRQWEKISPTPVNLSRPATRQPAENADSSPFSARMTEDADVDSKGVKLHRPDTGLSSTSAKEGMRERAKSKLDMKGFHHRHTSSLLTNHDFLHKKDSESDLTDSENEGRNDRATFRRGRAGTLSSDSNDLFHKQMMDLVAREAQEKQLEALPETETEHQHTPAKPVTEKHPMSSSLQPPDNRSESVAEASDLDQRSNHRNRRGSVPAHRSNRPSLEAHDPFSRRGSRAQDSSVPTSPELGPRTSNTVPFSNLELSSARSRSPSPSRNPVSRIKRRWRERDRDLSEKGIVIDTDDHGRRLGDGLPPSAKLGTNRTRPNSPHTLITGELPYDGQRGRRSTVSLTSREDQNAGFRDMLKTGRIDNVLRGGVSKFGDIIWKKNGSAEFSDPDITSESETESRRGGLRRSSLSLSRPASGMGDYDQTGSRHFLNAMPDFHHMAGRHTEDKDGKKKKQPIPRPAQLSPPGRSQSPRSQLLKPPRIDKRSASPSKSPSPSRGSVTASGAGSKQIQDSDSHLLQPVVSASSLRSNVTGRHWSIADLDSSSEPAHLTRRDVARVRALILSSGVKAMEISRRSQETHAPFAPADKANDRGYETAKLPWQDISRLSGNDQSLVSAEVPYCDLYNLASSSLQNVIKHSGQKWHFSADRFTTQTSENLQKRIWNIRNRLTQDLSGMAHSAADEADEMSRELSLGQPLKLKRVFDLIESMSRNRRRRFRWLRRGLWLVVEWLLVGIMWHVWFVVMVLRIFLGIGKGFIGGVKWLLWL